MRLFVAFVLLVGCYSPTISPGAPCGPGNSCPEELTCDTGQVPPICVAQGDDGGVPDGPPNGLCGGGCPTDQPICDNDVCRGCVADSECGDGACHELDGTCIASDQIVFMEAGAGGMNCTPGQPCGSFDNALNRVTADRAFIRIADGTYPQQLKLNIAPGGIAVTISGADATPDAIIAPGAGRGIEASDNGVAVLEGIKVKNVSDIGIVARGTLTLSNVTVTGSGSHGVDVRAGVTTLVRSSIDGNDGIGILMTGGKVDAANSFVSLNFGGGIDYANQNSSLTMRNSVIANNGSSNGPFGGVRIQALAPNVTFQFNTVIRNLSSAGGVSGFACTAAAVVVENSIIADNIGGPQIPPFCSARFSLFNPNGPSGNGNIIGDPRLDNATSGFHIEPGSPAQDAADPAATLATDIDGEVRSGPRDIGADEIP